jgi:hypothetical protein
LGSTVESRPPNLLTRTKSARLCRCTS